MYSHLRSLALLVLCAPTSAAFATTVQQAQPDVAFVDVNVLPMSRDDDVDARVLLGQTVLIRDGLIAAIGPAGEVELPEGVQRVDGKGRFLMPGLQDLHIHFVDVGDLFVYLANGVTSVRNLAGNPWHLEVRERIQTGDVLGPRFVTSGPFVNLPHIDTPDDAVQAVEHHVELGYDCIKIHGQMRLATYEILLETADLAGIPVVGHAPRNLKMETLLEFGAQLDISHGEEFLYTYFDRSDVGMTDEAIERVVAATKASGIAVVPNLIAYDLIGRQVRDLEAELVRPEMAWVPPAALLTFSPKYNRYARVFSPASVPALEENLAFLKRFTRALSDAGVPVLVGTDAMNPTVSAGFSVHQELELLVESGLTPYQALRGATVDAGPVLLGPNAPNPPGSIATGEPADLVLLDANPLDDIANAKRIAGVMTHGRWIASDEIDREMEALRAVYEIENEFASRVAIDSFEAAHDYYAAQRSADPDAFLSREEGLEAFVLVYLQVRKPELAIEVAELYLEEFPDSWRAHARFADALAAMGDTEYALESMQRALELAPEMKTLEAAVRRLDG